MFQSMRRAVVQGVEKTLNTFAAYHGDGKGDNVWDQETNLFKKSILMNAEQISESYDVETRTEAVRKIGHLAYTGGPDAAKCAGAYMETFVDFVSDPSTPPPLRIQAVRSISEICRGHRKNATQAHSLGFVGILLNCLRNGSDLRLVRWCCYTLVQLVSMSLVILKELQATDDPDLVMSLDMLSSLSWKGWPRNYAIVVEELAGWLKPDETLEQSN